jgi:hypothetical protein
MGAEKLQVGYMQMMERRTAEVQAPESEECKIEKFMGDFLKVYQWIMWPYFIFFFLWLMFF